MKEIRDYTILQRDKNGIGRGRISGERKADGGMVYVKVFREDDNMTVLPWTEAALTDDGWHYDFELPQGGLYRIEARFSGEKLSDICGKHEWGDLIFCASHIGVGDIFVMAGQSNMSGYGKDFAYDPPELGVHLYNNAGLWVLAVHPLNSVPNPIWPNNDINSGVSPALSFARMMKKRLGIPIGLISAVRGGTSLEDWNPAETEECYLYRAMTEKIRDTGGCAGILWYQGCNDTNWDYEAEHYLEKFTEAVRLWREEYGNIPIVTCQLNRHANKQQDRERGWGLVREAQRQAARLIDDLYVVPTLDLPTCDGIHNTSGACVIVGERMAAALLKGYYGLPGALAPSVKKIRKTGKDKILLTFDTVFNMRTMDDIASDMYITDDSGETECIKAEAAAEGLIVTAAKEITGKAYFSAYYNREVPAFFVRDTFGMPMLACYMVEICDD